eukprot:SAG31_NODE_2766_length_5123_cov_3.395900_1_plen_332_part_00
MPHEEDDGSEAVANEYSEIATSDLATAWNSELSPRAYVQRLAARLSKISTPRGRAAFKAATLDVLLRSCEVGRQQPSTVLVDYLDQALSCSLLPVNGFMSRLLPAVSIPELTPYAQALLPLMHRHAPFLSADDDDAPKLTLETAALLVKLLWNLAVQTCCSISGAAANSEGAVMQCWYPSREAVTESSLTTLIAIVGRTRTKSRALLLLAKQLDPETWHNFVEEFRKLHACAHKLILATVLTEKEETSTIRLLVSQALQELHNFFGDCYIPLSQHNSLEECDSGFEFGLRTKDEEIESLFTREELFRSNAIVIVLLFHEILTENGGIRYGS